MNLSRNAFSVRQILISNPDNRSKSLVVHSVAPQNAEDFVHGQQRGHNDFSCRVVLKSHSCVLPIGLSVQTHGRLPDDNVRLVSLLVTIVLGCRPHDNSYDRTRVELTGIFLTILKRLSPSNEFIFLALYYIRQLRARIPEEEKPYHSAEDCQHSACVSIAVKRLYVGMALACHWLADVDKVDTKSFGIPTTRAEVFQAMEVLRWQLFVSRHEWLRWLWTLILELRQSQDRHRDWCAGLANRLLQRAVSQA